MVQAAVRDDRSDTPAIDHAHLSRMTAGDVALERELLHLFDTQAALLLDRMHGGDSATVSALAHTLNGSALGIGAGAVARAAGVLERAGADQDAALLRLTIAVQEAHLAIAALLARSSE